jgi:hypothetical protein
MENEIRPTRIEKELLTLAYNAFYDIFEEAFSDGFWEKDAYYRFSRTEDAFSIYAELLNYPPLKWVIEYLKKKRPPMEAEIGSEFFMFARNILIHFPFFQTWEEVWINKNIVNWHKEGQSIDRFLTKYEGHEPVKYRFWEAAKKKMTYITITFPEEYTKGNRIFLKDILSEKDGVKFSLIFMRKVIDTQVESA